jgi:hypothetical protein
MQKIIHHIHNLRQKPEHVRRRILHVSTAAFGVLLVLLWIYSLGARLGDDAEQAKKQEEKSFEAFTTLKSSFIDGYYSLSAPTPESLELPEW